MTHFAPVQIWCDRPDCYVRIITNRRRVGEARQYAKDRGWKNIGGLFDLCGKPTDPDGDDPDARRWRGHADQPDHIPAIKAASQKGRIHLRCSCGWTAEPLTKYTEPGTILRQLAVDYWRDHVRDTLKEAKTTEEGRQDA